MATPAGAERRVIVTFPPSGDVARLAILRERFDPLARLVPPHITLVHPFADDISDGELRAHVEDATRGLPAFPVRLSGITGAEGEYVFLNVKQGNDALIELRDRLYAG